MVQEARGNRRDDAGAERYREEHSEGHLNGPRFLAVGKPAPSSSQRSSPAKWHDIPALAAGHLLQGIPNGLSQGGQRERLHD
jgi:hypothetical protein